MQMLVLFCHTAVQEERQRGKDRNENDVECSSSANEDMPVEKILEAELAVEPKTETYIEANMGLAPNSVSTCYRYCICECPKSHYRKYGAVLTNFLLSNTVSPSMKWQ